MFGKTKENSAITEADERADLDVTIDDFFGDETAVAEAVRVDQLHQRVTQVEQQISSQFTSLAAYAQIAQEQVELVRSEAQHSNERSEQRVVGLIERERSDRMKAEPGGGTDVTARLDTLDAQVAEIRDGLQQCLSNQKALADAITDLFSSTQEASAPAAADPMPPAAPVAPVSESILAPPVDAAPPMALRGDMPPPPPIDPSTLADLDTELEELGVNVRTDLGGAVPVAPITEMNDLVDGPIDGLSLA